MQSIGLGVLLSILLALAMSLGTCAGVDTSAIEEIAGEYGIAPSEQPLEDLGELIDEYGVEGEGLLIDEGATDEGLIGMPNPWHQVADAQEAAEGAGLDSFIAPEGFELTMGEPFQITYSYMDGVAQALYDYPASSVTVRKAYYAGDGDISGDYRTFDLAWTENIDGIDVYCEGNVEGMACKATFVDGDYMYSIVTLGLGGDESFGLGADNLAAVIAALR